jgi:hypothetical protein
MGTKPSVEIQHLRTSNEDGPKRPVETQRFFLTEITARAETIGRKFKANALKGRYFPL